MRGREPPWRAGAAHGELRIRGQVHAFDYPGQPVEPPVFRLR